MDSDCSILDEVRAEGEEVLFSRAMTMYFHSQLQSMKFSNIVPAAIASP